MEPVRYRVGPRITASIVAVSAVALFMAGVLSGSSSNFSLRQTLQQVDVMSSDAPPPEDNLACGDQCGSCGEGCRECKKQDCGSCGGACCTLYFHFVGRDLTTTKVAESITKVVAAGGADGRYEPGLTAEGTMGFADLIPYNKSVDYIGRFKHTTVGNYTDTINIIVAPRTTVDSAATSVQVRAFSISDIGGAYCDSGQNYKNLVALFRCLDFEWTMEHADGSCAGSDIEIS